MQGVSPLVRESGNRLVVTVVVHQDERVDIVNVSVHVGPRSLPLTRIHVHPLIRKAPCKDLNRFRTQNFGRLENDGLRLVDPEFPIGRYERWVDIVISELFDPQHPGPQPEVPVQDRQTAVRFGDQRPIHGLRDSIAVERCHQRARIAPDAGVEQVSLHLCIQGRTERPGISAPRVPEHAKHFLPVCSLGNGPEPRVGGLVESFLASIG